MKILTAKQMGEVDRLTTALYGIPSLLLMECAGRSVVDKIEQERGPVAGLRATIFSGRGNNGGDGFVVARHLMSRGGIPNVVLAGHPSQLRGDALVNWEMIEKLGIPVRVAATAGERRSLLRTLTPDPVIVDALFGTGLSKPLGADYKGTIEWINRTRPSSLVVSVDLPSGLFADSSRIPGPAIQADLTVTFTALKPALVLHPAAAIAGKLTVAAIGSPPSLVNISEHYLELSTATEVRRALPPRALDSHKGNYGHVLIVAGSRGKSGAALMTGIAALRSGAGLVTLWLPESLYPEVTGKFPELMTEYLPETADGTPAASGAAKVLQAQSQYDVMVIGPGITTQRSTRELVQMLVHHSKIPVVLDADGLNAFAGRSERLRNENAAPVVITPHPGEMARLQGTSIASVQRDRLATAVRFATTSGTFTILKGHQTVLATPLGQAFINPTGNPGMATGGSGDVLAGMVGRFVAGWWRRFRGADCRALADHLAAALYLHGLAGDLTAADQGEECLIATDLLARLPRAFRQVKSA